MASRSNLRIGMSLESYAAEVQLVDEFTLDERQVLLIDTPGSPPGRDEGHPRGDDASAQG